MGHELRRYLLRTAGRMVRLLARLRATRAARTISRIELSGCIKDYKTPQDFLLNLRSREKPLFLLNRINPETLRQILPQSEEIIKEADEVCLHNFDLLGSGKQNIDMQPGRIDWHRDFKSGERWEPETFYTDTVIIKGNGSDIKVPWELSRFQHLPTLGKAYWLSGDEKYSREFVNEIEDWIESNRPFYGVNWICAMDVAIRVVNWIWGYYFFMDSPEVTDEFLLKFLRSLLIHGKYIRGNLERGRKGINGNHYLSDIVGLAYIGTMFPEFKEAKGWRDFALKELIQEMGKQVYPDGVDYEGSISYHRLVTELFLSATLLHVINGGTFPGWYMDKLEKMIEFVMYYTKTDGTAPQIGDNDDGRLHILGNYENWNRVDHRYLLSIGAALFNRPDLKQAAGELQEEALWLLGEEGFKKFNLFSDTGTVISSKAFPDGGFYIMRNENLQLIADCVPASHKAPTGHKHNSRLSFELFAYDKSFIIDPGAYIYTADKDMRNLFRSTRYHNTVTVDGEEQNRFNENELFRLGYDAAVKVNKWEATDEYDIIDAEHNSYKRLRNPVMHRRLIFFDKQENYWVVKDILTGMGSHRFDLYFHFAPLKIELDGDPPLMVKTKVKGANLAIIPLYTDGTSVVMDKGWISFQYGVKIEAPIVKYQKEVEVPTEFCYALYPYEGPINMDEVKHRIKNSRALEILEVEG